MAYTALKRASRKVEAEMESNYLKSADLERDLENLTLDELIEKHKANPFWLAVLDFGIDACDFIVRLPLKGIGKGARMAAFMLSLFLRKIKLQIV